MNSLLCFLMFAAVAARAVPALCMHTGGARLVRSVLGTSLTPPGCMHEVATHTVLQSTSTGTAGIPCAGSTQTWAVVVLSMHSWRIACPTHRSAGIQPRPCMCIPLTPVPCPPPPPRFSPLPRPLQTLPPPSVSPRRRRRCWPCGTSWTPSRSS